MSYIINLGKYDKFEILSKYILDFVYKNKDIFYKINQLALQYYDYPSLDCANGHEKTKHENKFTTLMPCFEKTPVEEFFDNIGYKLCRTRVFLAKPNKIAYSVHKDMYKRLHLPIITNNYCFFTFFDPNEKKYPAMQADGSYYEVNTLVDHTFTNKGNIDRIHIVGSILE